MGVIVAREIEWYDQQVADLDGPDKDVGYLHLVLVDRQEKRGPIFRRAMRRYKAIDWTLYYKSDCYPNSGTFDPRGLAALENETFLFLGKEYSVNWLTGQHKEAVARKLQL